MLHSLEEEDDVFFDSSDSLSSEEATVANDLQFDKLDYEIWLGEPRSVGERRDNFLQRMGFVELACRNRIDESSQKMGLESARECNGAVSSSIASSAERAEDNFVFIGRDMICEANSMVDDEENFTFEDTSCLHPLSANRIEESRAQACVEEFNNVNKKMKWWKRFLIAKETNGSRWEKLSKSKSKDRRMKVQQNKKRCMELTALYLGQEILAHGGFIRTMKFSPDGRYLASGGEDGVVRIWRVMATAPSFQSFTDREELDENVNAGKSGFVIEKSTQAPIIIPEKVFHIDETPFQELRGHFSDVLDLAWSNSNHLLSSSMDKTVRLWQVGCDQCLNVFPHNNYVTCIQFNPVDENYFISGSIDGKARIWGVSEKRVVSWADVRDVISAICYQPDGKGFVVGSIAGNCRFYEASGSDVELEAQINVQGRKKTNSNKITGLQFCPEESQRLMITSDDSKLRIFDGLDVVKKYKGLAKSGSQMSASFTPTGKHIISVGEDCRVYVWNYDDTKESASKHKNSIRSCEHFLEEGVSVAVAWSGVVATDKKRLGCSSLLLSTQEQRGSSERFSLGRWFSLDSSSKGSAATWPEEKLPLWDVAMEEDDHQNNPVDYYSGLSGAWGLVVVTAGWDGRIRTFQNFGLPVRI